MEPVKLVKGYNVTDNDKVIAAGYGVTKYDFDSMFFLHHSFYIIYIFSEKKNKKVNETPTQVLRNTDAFVRSKDSCIAQSPSHKEAFDHNPDIICMGRDKKTTGPGV